MPKRRFASDTAVPVEQTRGEIEKLLRAEGAEGFGYSWEPKGDLITFRWRKANYLFRLPSIDKGAGSDRRRAQLDRQRWRALLLVIKAKVEAVASASRSLRKSSSRTSSHRMGPPLASCWSRGSVKASRSNSPPESSSPMRPYIGASVLYRDEHGSDYAAIITRLKESGEVDLTFFAPYAGESWATCRGWSHVGSHPDTPLSNTWRWPTLVHELGPAGRSFVTEMMTSPATWHGVLISFANMDHFRDVYRQQRTEAMQRTWPELPPDPPPDFARVGEFKTSNGTGSSSGGVLQ